MKIFKIWASRDEIFKQFNVGRRQLFPDNLIYANLRFEVHFP